MPTIEIKQRLIITTTEMNHILNIPIYIITKTK